MDLQNKVAIITGASGRIGIYMNTFINSSIALPTATVMSCF